MQSTYDHLEHCISNIIAASKGFEQIDQEKFDQFNAELRNSFTAIKKQMGAIVFKADCNAKIEIQIHHLQRHFVLLAEALNAAYSTKLKTARKLKLTWDIFQLASTTIESGLSFLEISFPQYINMQEKLPPGYKAILRRDLHERISKLQQSLQDLNIDQKFIQVIIDPATDLLDDEITYHDASYLKRMCCGLEQTIKTCSSQNAFQKLYELLVNINYNTALFIKYMSDHISIELGEAESRTEQLQILSWYLKHFSQMFQTNTPPFKMAMTGTRELLVKWVQVEISYVEKMDQLILIMPPDKETLAETNQIETSLSVHVFACLLRLFHEQHVFISPNKNDMLRLMARTFKTTKAERIAFKSLRNKYYVIEAATAKQVRSLLLDLANEVVRKFG